MSDSVRPQRRQPTRLLCPWDSPGKNTGVGCHFLLQCMKVKSQSEVAQSCPTPSDPKDCSPPGSSVHGISRQEYWSGVPLPLKYCNGGYIALMQDVNNRRYYGGERYIGTLYFLHDVSVNCSIDQFETCRHR